MEQSLKPVTNLTIQERAEFIRTRAGNLREIQADIEKVRAELKLIEARARLERVTGNNAQQREDQLTLLLAQDLEYQPKLAALRYQEGARAGVEAELECQRYLIRAELAEFRRDVDPLTSGRPEALRRP